MSRLLAIAALAEALTGVALLVFPAVVVRLLLGEEIAGVSVVIGRLTGIGLIALGVACWPGEAPGRGLSAMLTYSTLAALYLAYLGVEGQFAGVLLLPAVLVHAALGAALAVARFKRSARSGTAVRR